jgi:hypothetical protein
MARNSNRTNPNSLEEQNEPIQADSAAPIMAGAEMSWSTPTEFVELPSQGKFYPPGHPLDGEDTLEIRFMTAKEEDILTSRALIKKGIVLDRLIDSVIVNKAVKAKDLLIGDKNAVLIAIRVTGYGEEYSVKVQCPSCGSSVNSSFDVEEVKKLKESEMPDGVEFTTSNTFTLTAPATKAVVECRLMTGEDERRLTRMQEQRRKHKLPSASLTNQLRQSIVSVNGNDQAVYTNGFVDNMPARDSRYIREVYSKVMPNVTLEHTFECDSCDHTAEAQAVPLGTSFFWPDT